MLDDDNAWASLKYYRDTLALCLGTDDRYFRQKDLEQVKLDPALKDGYPNGYVLFRLEWGDERDVDTEAGV